MSKRFKVGAVAGLMVGALVAAASAAPAAKGGAALPSGVTSPFGAYLAGRHAQEEGAFAAAAAWYERALSADPQSPELISRTFLMEANAGHFNRALALAKQQLKLDNSDAVADLTLLIEAAKSGDKAQALARAEALPDDGLHRYVGPLARAWTRVAVGNLPGAEAALHDLDKFDGFAPLEDFQLGLVYDFAGNPAKAEEYYQKALAAGGQVNWRLAEAMANFYERHGRLDEAAAIERHRRDLDITRFGTPEDIAHLVAFAVSPKGRWIHGTAIDIDGGQVDPLRMSRYDAANRANDPPAGR